ncbi:tRNA (adenosine(37)-N6)-dimethylallyltransferase MiaA [Candidatus Adlerbacteria bacterium RIFOXYC1_FULL_48_26]|uniref:tRNA dimethylallyltransferase n=1 Tax=Candidatus Adlerbacteria bacterium RIFOXYC1_FULL_48_26 TaxID=1797247 RepID=A0A1F4Y3A8_9BACT|nr:MAG: tRNA (adenosine(37)-N6)-dimethylallyltransferase MiaA [Candidatus Adlerbacteria bacterium RIFOXYC1_FULL_48_26]OGC93412.1 MAG: tRNA (adenosine(37)-N6)-dimethylallyltransferase MiaA [Candidatus Adlerbacteria bacterium RIFOXYB1_FULL_48_10]OGC95957.1 MAG: tRNA (adenosine(37)-N6)-dimethylallyltransferase MiaA [Candidatus Adlerbacteria bacterium RIFOXYD1_FULL_48_8]
MNKSKVIAVVGPTASGKTALGIFLAQKLKGEVISADSRQIYKGLAAIARVPDKKERAGIPHHLIEFASPKRLYSAGEFKKHAEKIIADIGKKKHVPIVVGGTGFYADSLLRGFSLPEVEPNKKLRASLAKKTPAQLFSMLKKLDAKTAARIDAKNPARLVRAIEIAKAIGNVPELISDSPYEVLWLGLRPTEAKHEKAIRAGVTNRLNAMLREAKKLRTSLSKKHIAALGFELIPLLAYLDKKITKAELVEQLVRSELGYVKRQMRWFKRREDIRWVKNKTEALRQVRAFLH